MSRVVLVGRVIFAQVFIVCMLTYSYTAYATSRDTFAWLKPTEAVKIFEQIKKDFSEDLSPDDPKKANPIVPYLYKYISRVGCFNSSCIVLVGFREKESEPAEYDHFRAFTYDLIKRTKHEIEQNGVYYKWIFLSYSTFEPSLTPDIVFKYLNCMECEAVELISSFRFDADKKNWVLRFWPENDPHIMIDSDDQLGDDIWVYDCLFKVADFTANGFADIAVRCRETGIRSRKITDTTLLYTIEKGIPKKIMVEGRESIEQITSKLCEGKPDSPLCKEGMRRERW